MAFLGIDLASRPERTAAVLLDRRGNMLEVRDAREGCTDDILEELSAAAAGVGIDAPLGWPEAFREAVVERTACTWTLAYQREVSYRLTDLRIREQTGRWPLSVSTDRIALPAMRAMSLMHRKGLTDKSGESGWYEVYPAGSLAVWELPSRGYKADNATGRERRALILKGLEKRFGALHPEGLRQRLVATDHLLDALIAGLTAIEAYHGGTVLPSAAEQEQARLEGWIHLPKR